MPEVSAEMSGAASGHNLDAAVTIQPEQSDGANTTEPGIDLPLDTGPGTWVIEETTSGLVQRTIMPNGVRVLTEHIPGQRSVTVGCWVPVGSRDEVLGRYGSTHFLEHLLFKGTPTRSALEIAIAFDAVGGEANAFTGKEHTCYYARVLDDELPGAVDVLLEMVTSALLTDEDVASERGVILEELAMNDDDPSDVVHERFTEQVLADHALGRPIGGTPQTINAITADDIRAHYQEFYGPQALVVTAAGNVDHQHLCDMVTAGLTAGGWQSGPAAPVARRAADTPVKLAEPQKELVIPRALEQANVIVGSAGLTATDERRYAVLAMNAILGGGMSSRLFQEVREKRGLAYSVYSFSSSYADAGVFGLYAGCTPDRAAEVIELMQAELDQLAADGVSSEELARAHGQISGSTVLSLEDTSARMTRLGRSELVHGRYLNVSDVIAQVRSVTTSDVKSVAQTLAAAPRATTLVGPF